LTPCFTKRRQHCRHPVKRGISVDVSVIYRSGVDFDCSSSGAHYLFPAPGVFACRPLTAEMGKAIVRLQLSANNLLSTLKLSASPGPLSGEIGSATANLVGTLLRELKDVWQITGAPLDASDGWSLDSSTIAPLTASLSTFFEQSRDAVIAIKTRSAALQKQSAPAPVRMPTQVTTPNASGGVDIADVPPKSGPDSLPVFLIVGGVVVGGMALGIASLLSIRAESKKDRKMSLRRLHRGRG